MTELPSNHSPEFAPVINPILRVGIDAMLAAAGAWLMQPTDGSGPYRVQVEKRRP